jgi:fructose-1,6-bisphosphatase/inositol monophosphatase family enzyme
MVSDADLAVEKLIKERLLATYPDDAYLGEETGHVKGSDASGIWVVDPIDGTQPFLSGLRTWCISIAYVQANNVLIGMVNNPAAGELFTGGSERPAELNGRPIAPREAPSLADGLTYVGCNPRLRPEQVVPVLDRLLRAECFFVTAPARSGSAISLVDASSATWRRTSTPGTASEVSESAGRQAFASATMSRKTACTMAAPLSLVRLRYSINSS